MISIIYTQQEEIDKLAKKAGVLIDNGEYKAAQKLSAYIGQLEKQDLQLSLQQNQAAESIL